MAQLGEAEPGTKLAVVPQAPFPIEQQGEPFRVAQALGLGIGGEFAEGLGHADEPEAVETVEGRMGQHRDLLQW